MRSVILLWHFCLSCLFANCYCVKTKEVIGSYSSEQEQERLVVFTEPLTLCDAAENIHIYLLIDCDLFSSVV